MINQGKEKRLKEYIERFKEYSKTEEFKEDMRERKERELFFRRIDWENLQNMDEFLFGEMISKLWASSIWGNKNYLVKKIISENNFTELKSLLWNLIFAKVDLPERYDSFLENVKGLGPSSITELLCMFKPKEYGIWNDKARKALKILDFKRELPLNKYKINGEEYKKFNEVLKQISYKLQAEGFENVDLLFVDYFLYEVWKRGDVKEKKKIEEQEKSVFDHDEVRDYLKDIGDALGFDAEIEKKVAHGSVVDVIWKAKIANLGVVIYTFEVQKGGSVKSLILNLQKARNNRSVQKVIAVSDKKQIEKIKRELIGLPEDFRKSFSFWDFEEVKETYQKLSDIAKVIGKLDLVQDEFELEE